ncbi:hypothetical protein [Spirochaeta isovalerica]|uniref:Uncharacterized protein n=1 Tax=Spirochaeta isovalerica TaxID=150 RepID=A0A841R7F3_9SPIO|nr:hypothetical protein [Spirochaeta isovalerica]MBB6478970.1 hypothetical protein [Spirochaeta isovalerica]
MDSTEFIRDFTEWIKENTSIEALYIYPDKGKTAFIVITSNKRMFLQNFMIFSDYDRTTYCKLFNNDDLPYLEIEFRSGHEALIEFVSENFEITDNMKVVFDKR